MATARYVLLGLTLMALCHQAYCLAYLSFGWINFMAVVACSMAVGVFAAGQIVERMCSG